MRPVPERILDAAAELVRAGTALTVSAVAGRAGVARGTVYRYHPRRSALMAALVASGRLAADELPGAAPAERILDAVGLVLARHGLAGTTIEAVARQAGLAPVTIYRHFGDRRGLLRAFVSTRTPRRLAAELPAVATGDVGADLTIIAREILGFLAVHRDLFLLAFSADAEAAALFGDVRQGSASIRATLADYLAAAIPGAGAPEAHAFLGMLLGLAWGAAEPDVDERARLAVRVFLRGVPG